MSIRHHAIDDRRSLELASDGLRRTRPNRAGVLLVMVSLAVTSACGSSGSTTAKATVSGGDFGTMKNVCHTATSPNKATGSIGVTANSVRVTTISDANFTAQKGINQELWDASKVFVEWCNDHGGINGRKIDMVEGDAQITLYPQVINDACVSSFALVGGGGAFDDSGQAARVKCLLPDFPAFEASSQARSAALAFPAVPTPVSARTVGLLRYITKKYPDSIHRVGMIYGDFASVKMIKDQVLRAGVTTLGWDYPKYQAKYGLTGEASWQPFASAIASNQITGLVFEGQPKDLGQLMVAIKAIGYTGLKWVFSDSNQYDQQLIQSGGNALDATPIYVPLFLYPFEGAAQPKLGSAAIDDYLAMFKKYLPDGKSRALLGLNSFTSWLLFVTVASKCGADLTRKCLVEQASKTTSFDAGGLSSPRDPANPLKPASCFTAVQATSSGFKLVDDISRNKGIFNCGPNNTVDITNTVLPGSDGVKMNDQYPPGPSLADEGKSLSDLK